MTVDEHELRERLESDDDGVVEATLHEHFHPVPRAPLTYDWCPVVEEHADHDDDWVRRLIGVANAAERRLRVRRFRWRRRNHPDWPIILCEGDSWVAHPQLRDLTDHLLDEDRFQFNVWAMGAAGDCLDDMAREREQEHALDVLDASALLLSGGGNDLIHGFEALDAIEELASDPVQQALDTIDPFMSAVMCSMQTVLEGVRARAPELPIVVHGYDYLRVAKEGKGKYLGPHLDPMGITDDEQRRFLIKRLVDRFNEDLVVVGGRVPGVHVVDLRGMATDKWHDEIHPKKDGFEVMAAKIGQTLQRVIAAD
ncbi:MAG: SGNH/GDSL hydrolase family protein [Myxococcota bacterium]